MSDNSTIKLYTEEQLTKYLLDEGIMELSDLANNLIPHIELPTDEEIYIEAQNKKDNIKKLPFDSVSFQFGAIWLKDKIQGGNK